MSNIVIRAEKISKLYKIGVKKQPHDTLRDEIAEGFKSLFHRNGRSSDVPGHDASVWALKDVSFEVREGEILGIVGQNGAGKSTLLKILSRITHPTEGWVEIHGRVGSLLEVGTGFHGELTGRENVYLNGAILGMKKTEIHRKFDEIVAFAEVEKFIDTPVKRYSSGMDVLLALAVAAHMEKEILIMDEVLAVGDLNFQKRCLGKMGDVARDGRTVLFVSHNMGAVSNFCTIAMWIHDGQLALRGDIESVVSSYVKSNTLSSQAAITNLKRTGTGEARLISARLLDAAGNDCTTFSMGETIVLEFEVEFYRGFSSVDFTLEINRTEIGMRVLHLQNDDGGFAIDSVSEGVHRFRVEIPNCLLYPSSYEI